MSLISVLQPHPEDRLHLRLHRARSVILTAQEFVPPASLSSAPASCVRLLPRTNTWKQSLAWTQMQKVSGPSCPRRGDGRSWLFQEPTLHSVAFAPTFWNPFSFFTFLFRFSVPLHRIYDRAMLCNALTPLPDSSRSVPRNGRLRGRTSARQSGNSPSRLLS